LESVAAGLDSRRYLDKHADFGRNKTAYFEATRVCDAIALKLHPSLTKFSQNIEPAAELLFSREPQTRENALFTRELTGSGCATRTGETRVLEKHPPRRQVEEAGTRNLVLFWAACTMCAVSAVGWKPS